MNEQAERGFEDSASSNSQSTRQLLEECLVETKELARLEVALAKDEARAELGELRASAVLFLVAGGCAAVSLSALVTSVILVTGYVVGLIAFAVLLAAAIAVGYAGYKRVPTRPMEKTRRRLTHESHDIRERLA